MNRGVARRAIFETVRDLRLFEQLLGEEVRSRRIEVHAFALLLNHFHLLVRSPVGRVSDAMRMIQGRYARRFNRSRERDGPLHRGRFSSRVIGGDDHWFATVRYIDANPVKAGITSRADQYPHGSAYWYRRRAGPRWLTRTRIEEIVREACGSDEYDPAGYEVAFPPLVDDSVSWWIEQGLNNPARATASLVEASPDRVRAWLLENEQKADGRQRSRVVVAPRPLLSRIASAELDGPSSDRRSLEVGLLRNACGLSRVEVASLLGISISTVSRATAEHRHHLTASPEYAERAARIVRESIDEML